MNYFNDLRLSEQQVVKKGIRLKPSGILKTSILPPGKEYEILEVNSSTMITVRNDKDKVEMYTVEHFTLYNLI